MERQGDRETRRQGDREARAFHLPSISARLLVCSIGCILVGLGSAAFGQTPDESSLPAGCRANCPPQVACYAVPSNTRLYCGYRVGGGCLCHGDCASPTDGTWGWDYRGLIPRY